MVPITAKSQNFPDITLIKKSLEHMSKVKKEILKDDDYQMVGDSLHVKKSGCIKYALGFGLSTQVIDAKCTKDEDGKLVAVVIARALHVPTGRFTEQVASCHEREKFYKEKKRDEHGNVMYDNGKTLYTGNKIAQDLEQMHHNLIATAGTRALNRAILAFVGTAEVSFNELSSTDAARNASPTTTSDDPHALPETGRVRLDGGEMCVCGKNANVAPEPEGDGHHFKGWYMCLKCNKPNKPTKDK